ncbi:uncharacterized protein FTOL_07989 [Fusarium torulosum]|uniref:Hydrophobin n=1 Tax=Fusarium torulosum TaxID=33205 RepID=A0AAE8SJJ8_9HYPO|nr:uncharacterized protein FTOL_07989 [Fusarium torulosum]
MKPSMIIALPALALAAASPVQVEERQAPGLDLTCVSKITGLTACAPSAPNLQNPLFIIQLVTCPIQVIAAVVACVL